MIVIIKKLAFTSILNVYKQSENKYVISTIDFLHSSNIYAKLPYEIFVIY